MSVQYLMADDKTLAASLARRLMAGAPLDEYYLQEDTLQARRQETGDPVEEEERIGVWTPVTRDGAQWYVRDNRCNREWFYWANVPAFPLNKNGRRRIVFTGESVARGFLYDPAYNPGMELQARLDAWPGLPATEVIDLARNGMDMAMLQDTCTRSMVLEPDALVVFAGNNWLRELFAGGLQEAELAELTAKAQAGDLAGFRKIMEDKLTARIAGFTAHLQKLAGRHGTEVIIVLPAYNLLDWKSSALEQRMSRLDDADLQQWHTLATKAPEQLAAGEYAAAAATAGTLLTLDPGNPLGYEILAACKLQEGDHTAAGHLLQEARDTAVFGRANSCGRNLEMSREWLKKMTVKYGFHCVDLPAIFQHHLGGALPGRQLFLDYCHMTEEGITLAVTHIANAAVKALYPAAAAPGSIPPRQLSAGQKAMAHIFAAMHNAHNGQPQEIVTYHCRMAVQLSGTVNGFVKQYAALASRKVSNVIGKNYEAILANGYAEQYSNGHLLLHPRGEKAMDISLVDIMVNVMQETGTDIRSAVERCRITEHAAAATNLLAPYYALHNYQDAGVPRSAYYKCTQPESTFYYITGGAAAATLTACARHTGAYAGTLPVNVYVNDVLIAFWELAADWQTYRCAIPAEHLRTAVNRIRLCSKPVAALPLAAPPQPALSSLYDLLYPAFGEIHSLTIQQTANPL